MAAGSAAVTDAMVVAVTRRAATIVVARGEADRRGADGGKVVRLV